MSPLSPAQRDIFDKRYTNALWRELREHTGAILTATFDDAATREFAIASIMRIFDLYRENGVLEAGLGGQVFSFFLHRTGSIVKQAENIPFAREKERLAVALVEIAMCACAEARSMRGKALLSAIWKQSLKIAQRNDGHHVYTDLSTVLDILTGYKRIRCVQCAIAWSGVLDPEGTKERFSDSDLAKILSIARETFARRKTEGLDIVLLLSFMRMR